MVVDERRPNAPEERHQPGQEPQAAAGATPPNVQIVYVDVLEYSVLRRCRRRIGKVEVYPRVFTPIDGVQEPFELELQSADDRQEACPEDQNNGAIRGACSHRITPLAVGRRQRGHNRRLRLNDEKDETQNYHEWSSRRKVAIAPITLSITSSPRAKNPSGFGIALSVEAQLLVAARSPGPVDRVRAREGLIKPGSGRREPSRTLSPNGKPIVAAEDVSGCHRSGLGIVEIAGFRPVSRRSGGKRAQCSRVQPGA